MCCRGRFVTLTLEWVCVVCVVRVRGFDHIMQSTHERSFAVVTPVPATHMPSFLVNPQNAVRMTPCGKCDILDTLTPLFNSRDSAKHALARLLEVRVGESPSVGDASPIDSDASSWRKQIEYVRWTGTSGRYPSQVAPLSTILTIALSLRTRGAGELRSAMATVFIRALLRHQGFDDQHIAQMEGKSENAEMTDTLSAAVGLPVTSSPDQEARANIANSTSNNTVNTFFQPNTVQLHGSASPAPEREEGGVSPYKITGFTEVCTDLEQFRDIKGPGIDVREMVTYSSATLAAYAERNKAAARLFQLHVREREMELERNGKRQKLELLGEAAKMLRENSAFTQAARHNLARSVAILTTPSTPREKDEDELSSESEEGPGELTITGGDPEVLRQFGIAPCPPAPRITASKHFQELTGVSISDKIFEKQLQQAVYNTFKNLYGTEHARVRGKANKIHYTQAELKRLKPVFSRFIQMSNVDKVTTPAEV